MVFSQVVLLFPRTRLLQDSQSFDFPAAYQFHTTISDSLLPFKYPVGTLFRLPRSRPNLRLSLSSKPDYLRLTYQSRDRRTGLRTRAATSGANRGFWLLSTLFSSMTYCHIPSHTVCDPSSQGIVADYTSPVVEPQRSTFRNSLPYPSN
ncbi:hypothetical protein D6D27_05412 [Aureobasidium pullulans]|nr:hypothetical protein D6D27_05412 [Aureobasidium pullulans]